MGNRAQKMIARRKKPASPPLDASDSRGKGMPGNCLRTIGTSRAPEGGSYCHPGGLDCPGIQRDGGCLAQIIMAAWDQDADWRFEVNKDSAGRDWWDYVGEPLKPFEPKLPANVPPLPEPEPTEFEFVCPHCRAKAVHPLGFYWCGSCGKNANDP